MGHTTTQFCCCCKKAAIGNVWMNGHGCVLIHTCAFTHTHTFCLSYSFLIHWELIFVYMWGRDMFSIFLYGYQYFWHLSLWLMSFVCSNWIWKLEQLLPILYFNCYSIQFYVITLVYYKKIWYLNIWIYIDKFESNCWFTKYICIFQKKIKILLKKDGGYFKC